MGLYPIDCPTCGKTFMWFSGRMDQRCGTCRETTEPKFTFTPAGQSGIFQDATGQWKFCIDGVQYELDYLRRLIEEDAINNHK